ncbi:hypothetical protein GW17_00056786 [Ensete ventricosum]|nr:hypothetical protein GW17_00056786 [Ensete ventricosum]
MHVYPSKKKDLNITSLEAYTMASEEAISAKFEAFENHIDKKIRSLFVVGRKGLLPTARPQGAAARCKAARGSPAASAAACKGGRWQERPPAREVLPKGSCACRRGGCPCRWHAEPPPAQGSDSADWGKERARASF